MLPRITQESCSPRVSDRTMVGILPSGYCLQGVRVERPTLAMKPAATATRSGHTSGGTTASFGRHGEIFRNEGVLSAGQASARPSPQHFDEFPVGYSLAGCSPAEPTSASPTAPYCAVRQQPRRVRAAQHPVSTTQGWMPKKIPGTRPGRSVFFLTSPLIEPAYAEPPGDQAANCRTSRKAHRSSIRPVEGIRFAGMHHIHSPQPCQGQNTEPPPLIT